MIGGVIESYANRFGYSVVGDFTGHGIGTTFHNGLGRPALRPARRRDHPRTRHDVHHRADDQPGSLDYEIWDDGWTVVTVDKKWTAQFEHTLVVTENGADILTLVA